MKQKKPHDVQAWGERGALNKTKQEKNYSIANSLRCKHTKKLLLTTASLAIGVVNSASLGLITFFKVGYPVVKIICHLRLSMVLTAK